MIRFALVAAVQRYAGKVRTLRNEIRTEREVSALPAYIRADIGWPERYFDERGRR